MKKFIALIVAVTCLAFSVSCSQKDVQEFVSELVSEVIGEYPEEVYEEYKVERFSEVFGDMAGENELGEEVCLRLYENGIAEMVLFEGQKAEYGIEFGYRTCYRGNFTKEENIVLSEMTLTQKVVFDARLYKDLYVAAITTAFSEGGSSDEEESGNRDAALQMAEDEGYVLNDEEIEFFFTLIEEGKTARITKIKKGAVSTVYEYGEDGVSSEVVLDEDESDTEETSESESEEIAGSSESEENSNGFSGESVDF